MYIFNKTVLSFFFVLTFVIVKVCAARNTKTDGSTIDRSVEAQLNKRRFNATRPPASLVGVITGNNVKQGLYNPQDDYQVGCKELRSKRFISDGFCTSIKPITEVVCAGHCLPIQELPWYAEFIKVWSKKKILEWRCVNDVVKRRRVKLLCENGEIRSYKIKVVKSCKCKRYRRRHNQSKSPKLSKKRRRRRRRNKRKRDEKRRRLEQSNS